MNWTNEQEKAIYEKDSNILVAAAAGSGKTAVLVERIIQKILKYGVDIDKLLVVTFTNAAASEMRERVLEAIYKKLDEEPEDENLQKQIVLLGKSNICTIHSFCLDVIKNNFFEIDLSANFRIGSEEEVELLKQDVLEDLFEELYENEDEEFLKLVDIYTGYRGDEPLKELIFNIYRFIQSAPFPKDWLEDKINMFNIESDNDFSESTWGKILLKKLREELYDGITSLKLIKSKVDLYSELNKYSLTLEDDIEKMQKMYDLTEFSWDDTYNFFKELKFKSWPIDKKITMDLKNEAKNVRDSVKTKTMKTLSSILLQDSESSYKDIFEMYPILCALRNVILKFDMLFKEKKKEKNIIDFNDIEHYALQILVKKDEDGNYVATDVAKKYREKFEEIAIDEYQDSNEVQEYILSTISRGNNMFMVGDVKQSIYKFRQACPDLFLKKYDLYTQEGNENGKKIQLFKNFRSCKNVLDITNTVFETIMSKDLGDIDYNEDEFLNLGADFEEIENGLGKAEIHIIELEDKKADIEEETEENNENHKKSEYGKDDEKNYINKYNEYDKDDEDSEEEILRQLEKDEIEAKFVAKKIEELIFSKLQVKDKKEGYRDIKYKDIVILLRSPSKIASIYEKECLKRNIPVFSDCSSEYLDTIEIQTMINLLKILDNPIDDIALVSVLRSEIGGFDDNELLEIRLCEKEGDYYNSLIKAREKIEGELGEKVNNFLNTLENWREENEYLSLAELIWKIYIETGYYNYVGLMPNGSLRQANLKMLFERAKEYEKTSFRGLFNFIKFIERLRLGNNDMSSAKIIGENEDVVRIMSIHKSKGLEFPVVFLSNTSKKINLMDLNSNMLLHKEIGLGPKYINYERRIEYSTTAREAIKIISKEETISEEMRVLYVALTRAKEKLIITGTSRNYKKDLEKKKEFLSIYKSKEGKINPILLKKYTSYLDWLELVFILKEMNDKILVSEELSCNIENEEEKEVEIREFDFEKHADFSFLEKEFSWKYEYLLSTKLPIKSTVSKIKQMQNMTNDEEIDFEDLSNKKIEFTNSDNNIEKSYEKLHNKEIGLASITPNFLKEEEKISGSRKGTIIHMFLQRLDLRHTYSMAELKELKEELIARKIITNEEADTIYLNKILKFLDSELAQKIKNSKEIEKEKAFCMKVSAKEIFEEAKDEEILVQGIIDLYCINEDDEIMLVDYKTDFVQEPEELIQKYNKQLELYKIALEEATGKKVSEKYIYSLYLDKEIKL